MAEVIGLVASVIQVASSGLRLSRTLRDYSSAVQGSEKRLKGLDKDIYFTSNIISELATLLKDPRVQGLVSERSVELTCEIVAEFEGMFEAIEDVIEGIRADGLGKWRIYFRESKIGLLLSNLDRLKGNLQLLIGVITHASQISTEPPNDATMIAHRIKILELMLEKEEYTQKYLDEKRKYEDLMAQVNSTSTLGSVSTIQTSHSIALMWANEPLPEEPGTAQDVVLDELPESGGKGKEVANDEPAEARLTTSRENGISEDEAGNETPTTTNALLLKTELARLRAQVKHTEKTDTQASCSLQPDDSMRIRNSRTVINALEAPRKNRPLWQNSSAPETADTKQLQKRDAAAKVGKKIAKGTGYVAAGTVALIFFPITIGVLLYRRKKRASRIVNHCQAPEDPCMSFGQPSLAAADFSTTTIQRMSDSLGERYRRSSSPIPQLPTSTGRYGYPPSYRMLSPPMQQQSPFSGNGGPSHTIGFQAPMPQQFMQPQYSSSGHGSRYDSVTIPAELPGFHELPQQPELGLVAELTTYRGPEHYA